MEEITEWSRKLYSAELDNIKWYEMMADQAED